MEKIRLRNSQTAPYGALQPYHHSDKDASMLLLTSICYLADVPAHVHRAKPGEALARGLFDLHSVVIISNLLKQGLKPLY